MPRPFTSEEMLELGTACYEKEEYQEAIDAFTKVNILLPFNPDIAK